MGGELKDVAKGTIVQPKNRVIHGKPMSDSLHRVCVASVSSGCDDVDPPVQPEGAEEHMTLGGCHGWTLLWPKTQIRLAVEVTTPQTAQPPAQPPPVVATNIAAPPSPSPPPYEGIAHDDDDDDNIDNYINTGGLGGLFMPSIEEPYRETRAREDLAGRGTCTQRLVFGGSQEMPPAGADVSKPARGIILSPNTLHRAATQQMMAGEPPVTKKGRKRSKKPASQPATKRVIRAQDDVAPKPKDVLWQLHVAGKPMLPPAMLKAASGAMRNVHDSVLHLESLYLRDKNPPLPVFNVKVPKGKVFVDGAPADLFFLRFDDIFQLLNTKRLDYTLVRLFSLHMAMKVEREKIPSIAIVDPYYIRDNVLSNAGDRTVVRDYLRDIMLVNKRKDYILIPFFPE